jgi:hypothetical protein
MRFIYDFNGTLTDITKKIESYKTGSHTFSYDTPDHIYIGNDLPFNNLFFKLSTPNVVTTTMKIQYWDGSGWHNAAEIIDETESFKQTGFVTFTPDRNKKWISESTNENGQSIPALSSFKIYDLYWLRVSFNDTLTASVVLSWIGNVFSDDYDLYAEFPIFNNANMKSVFETGKTSWEEQHVKAGSVLVKDLIAKNVIKGSGNILKKEDFVLASVSKCAQIIFIAMGDDYTDDALAAKSEYKERLDNGQYAVDTNDDAILDVKEKFNRVGFMTR